MNIKLSDAFRGRYAVSIGGPCRVFFMAQKKNDKRKESERVEILPSPQRMLPIITWESFYTC